MPVETLYWPAPVDVEHRPDRGFLRLALDRSPSHAGLLSPQPISFSVSCNALQQPFGVLPPARGDANATVATEIRRPVAHQNPARSHRPDKIRVAGPDPRQHKICLARPEGNSADSEILLPAGSGSPAPRPRTGERIPDRPAPPAGRPAPLHSRCKASRPAAGSASVPPRPPALPLADPPSRRPWRMFAPQKGSAPGPAYSSSDSPWNSKYASSTSTAAWGALRAISSKSSADATAPVGLFGFAMAINRVLRRGRVGQHFGRWETENLLPQESK